MQGLRQKEWTYKISAGLNGSLDNGYIMFCGPAVMNMIYPMQEIRDAVGMGQKMAVPDEVMREALMMCEQKRKFG